MAIIEGVKQGLTTQNPISIAQTHGRAHLARELLNTDLTKRQLEALCLRRMGLVQHELALYREFMFPQPEPKGMPSGSVIPSGSGGLSQASIVFTPLSLTNLFGWYDFSDITTLFQDAARTTPVTADGQPIGGVLDKSGLGANLTASGTARPTYKAAVQNGRSVARFNGTSNELDGGTTAIGTNFTAAFAAQCAASASFPCLLSYQGAAIAELRFNNASLTPEFVVNLSSATWGSNVIAGSWHDFMGFLNPSSVAGGVTGFSLDNGTPVTGGVDSTAAGNTTFGIGNRPSSVLWFNGDIGEVILANSYTTGQAGSIRTYYQTRWLTP